MPSVSQAKNIMLRSISEIVDPGLTHVEKDLLWQYFRSSCAFCGEHIERVSRTGHVDHLESNAGNGPGNRVLACARCNGDEKRERPWRAFLEEKCPIPAVFEVRLSQIEAWVASHPIRNSVSSPEVKQARKDAQDLVKKFHEACTRLREAVRAASV